MYGTKALLIFVAFAVVAFGLSVAIVTAWKKRPPNWTGRLRLAGITAFFLLWFGFTSSVFIQRMLFLHELRSLDPTNVDSIQIGRHNFTDQKTIEDIVGALHQSRWFEVNHGGWANSVPLIIRRRSAPHMVMDVALYFREPGAIVGPSNPRGLGYSRTHVFAPDLHRTLEKHSVKLPDCDTAHDKPCTPEQLNP